MFEQVREMDRLHLIHPSTSMREMHRTGPRLFVRGEGARVFDDEGREFIDAFAGMGALAVGHGRVEIADAVHSQMINLAYFPTYYGGSAPPTAELADQLARRCPGDVDHFFFTSGGSEANETAIKVARLYWNALGQPGRFRVLSRRQSYHGLTLATMAATHLPAFREGFGPLPEGFDAFAAPYCYRCEFAKTYPSCGLACAFDLEQAIELAGPDTVAAVIFEPVQGSGGHIPPPDDYLPRLVDIARKHGILVIADEVVCGFGRTGRYFGCDHWAIEPDIMTFAKSLTSGYMPLGACGLSGRVYEVLRENEKGTFAHGFTFSGHTAACAAALANLKIIDDERLVDHARDMGERFLSNLAPLRDEAIVGDLRGKGLIVAVELVADRATKQTFGGRAGRLATELCREAGVICRGSGDRIMLRPPLCISSDEVDSVCDAVTGAVRKIQRTPL